jgi:hypothetical protein
MKRPEAANYVDDDSDDDVALGVSDISVSDIQLNNEELELFDLPAADYSEYDNPPESVQVSDSSENDDFDWFSAYSDEQSEWGDESNANSDRSSNEESVAFVTHQQHTLSTRTELYDSGTTRHISPYRDQFMAYHEIPPKPLNAANQQKFVAVGKGDIIVEVPNGVEMSKLTLTEVLYSPEVGYTLVSIGRLDEEGYVITFGNGECSINSHVSLQQLYGLFSQYVTFKNSVRKEITLQHSLRNVVNSFPNCRVSVSIT